MAIVQSNYIPWKGYFDLINMVDEFILYDDAQFTKRDWRSRNRIKTPNGPIWLSIPIEVKGKYTQAIKDTRVSDSQWNPPLSNSNTLRDVPRNSWASGIPPAPAPTITTS